MYNYQILTTKSKMEILEKLVLFSLYTNNWELYEETADHLTWLFEKMTPEVEKIFFDIKTEKEMEVSNVQLSEN